MLKSLDPSQKIFLGSTTLEEYQCQLPQSDSSMTILIEIRDQFNSKSNYYLSTGIISHSPLLIERWISQLHNGTFFRHNDSKSIGHSMSILCQYLHDQSLTFPLTLRSRVSPLNSNRVSRSVDLRAKREKNLDQ